MIISASRRTDIPAFFGEWFSNRIKAGFFYRVNPYNARQVKAFSLLPEDVDAFVFCTKNPRPFFKHLDLVESIGYHYLFHYTLNDYSRILEPGVPSLEQRIDTFKKLSDRIGPKRIIWRYDPIILSSLTPVEYQIEAIMKLANQLSGYTERVIISFLDFYQKVGRRLNGLATWQGVRFQDWLADENRETLDRLCLNLSEIAKAHNLQVFSCAEAIDRQQFNIAKGSCIDGDLINQLFGLGRQWRNDPGQRENCRCVAAVDMGVYNTCKFHCVYCYANNEQESIGKNLARHYLDSAALIGRYEDNLPIIKEKSGKVGNTGQQLTLYDD